MSMTSTADPSRYVAAPGCGDTRVESVFERQALAAPSAAAIVTDRETVSYRELDRRANRLAQHLRKRGVTAGSRAAVCVTRSSAMVEVVLAILKCGGTYVPLDPKYPAERLRFLLSDSDSSLLVTESPCAGNLDFPAERRVLLDVEAQTIAAEPDFAPQVENPAELAYLIYTSGTTGRPKGVMIGHRNVIAYARSMRERIGVTSDDTWLHTASLAFSSSVRQIFVPLSAGAAIAIASTAAISDPVALFELVRRKSVTIIDIVPTYWKVCVDALEQLSEPRRRELLDNGLRLILSASEALWSDVPRRWAAFNHPAKLINMFGQTETAGIACTHPIAKDDWKETRIVPIGAPIPGARVYLLDESGQPVSAGQSGYLHVGGPCVGFGYWRLPDETARAFVNPFGDGVLYRTGDLARTLPNGELEFVGRADHQVKIRGHRIEPGEIETALRRVPGVADAVVRALQQPEPVLVAYVVPRPAVELTRSELHNHLSQALPQYMLPAEYVMLTALPLTPNGKIDRLNLPDPAEAGSGSQQAGVAPRDSVEKAVAAIWTDVLRSSSPGVFDDFLAIGGNSLLAMQVLIRVRAIFRAAIPLEVFFADRTIAALSQCIRQREAVKGNADRIGEIVAELRELSPGEAASKLQKMREAQQK